MTIGIIVVDMQNDFSENGALPVPEASQVIPVINKLISQLQTRAVIVYTKDWHPKNHVSFAKNGGTWPVHCVQGSKGAELIDGLVLPENAIEVRKGADPIVDSYSAFGGWATGIDPQPLDQFLKAQGVDAVYVMGLATDFCVKETALDAKKLGYKTIFVENASKGISQDSVASAMSEMQKAGISFLKAY
jgi:nicotinamidase/pyrazinamidase